MTKIIKKSLKKAQKRYLIAVLSLAMVSCATLNPAMHEQIRQSAQDDVIAACDPRMERVRAHAYRQAIVALRPKFEEWKTQLNDEELENRYIDELVRLCVASRFHVAPEEQEVIRYYIGQARQKYFLDLKQAFRQQQLARAKSVQDAGRTIMEISRTEDINRIRRNQDRDFYYGYRRQ